MRHRTKFHSPRHDPHKLRRSTGTRRPSQDHRTDSPVSHRRPEPGRSLFEGWCQECAAAPNPINPTAGQESAEDYPRPPKVEPRSERFIVRLGGLVIADTTDAVRILETSHPAVYYLTLGAFPSGILVPAPGTSICEYKGEVHYFDVMAGGLVASLAGWIQDLNSPQVKLAGT